MTEKCPTCGAPWPSTAKTHVDLANNVAVFGNRAFKLQPREAEALHLLLSQYPNYVSKDWIMARLEGWGDTRGTPASLRVIISRLRKRIFHSSWTIVSLYGTGYALRNLTVAEGRAAEELT
jgi:two-component system response regulator TctD